MIKIVLKSVAIVATGVVVLVVMVGSYFTVRALARERLEIRSGTRHASLSRESCIECTRLLPRSGASRFTFAP